VLALAAGQDVSLLCRSWCPPPAAAAGGCEHEGSVPSPNVVEDEICVSVMFNAAFLKEDRGASTSGTQHTVIVTPDPLNALMSGDSSDHHTAHLHSPAPRPPDTALRL